MANCVKCGTWCCTCQNCKLVNGLCPNCVKDATKPNN
jgi:hypothetical protein